MIAFFESNGLYVYDMDGTLVWSTDLGDKRVLTEGGEGTTPALYGNTLVLVWDNNDQSFIVAFDKGTGEELWRVARDELDTWSTPIIVEHGGRRRSSPTAGVGSAATTWRRASWCGTPQG